MFYFRALGTPKLKQSMSRMTSHASIRKTLTHIRNRLLPEHLRWPKPIKSLTFFIPKFHIKAHISHCQLNYSFNLTKGVGRTDGEAPERGWAAINPIATSTKEMGLGHTGRPFQRL